MPAAGATEVAGTAQFTLERPIAAPRADNNVSVEVKGLRVEYRWVDGRWLAGRVFDARTQAPLALGAFKAFGR
ncbi:MAG: hypothetical protein HY719_17270 [Planctomycetes bacterium]|nr:hypothetical protein [Planctomycetota bacterium]